MLLQRTLTDGRLRSESKIWGCFTSVVPERNQMEFLVGKVSLALSCLWDGAIATQPGECQWSAWSLPTATSSCRRITMVRDFLQLLETIC